MIDPRLLEILVCPACRGDLLLAPEGDGLVCARCRVRYPIRDGIPILLIDEGESLGSSAPESGAGADSVR